MMPNDEPTPGELDRRLDRIEASIDRGFAQINERLGQMVTSEVFALYQSSINQRIDGVESSVAQVDERRGTDRTQLQTNIDAVEQARAEDRRMITRLTVTGSIGLLGVLATLAGLLLPLLTGT